MNRIISSLILLFFSGLAIAQTPNYRLVLQAGGQVIRPLDVAVGTDSTFIIAGHTGLYLPATSPWNYFFAKVQQDGTPLFAKSFNEGSLTDQDQLTKIIPLDFGEFLVIGHSFSTSTDAVALVGRFSKTGNPIWMRTFSNLNSTGFDDGIIDDEANLILVGKAGFKDWVVKMDLNGQVLAQKNFDLGLADQSPIPNQIMRYDDSFIIRRSFFGNTNCGAIFYKITSGLQVEMARAISVPVGNPLTIYRSLNNGTEIDIVAGRGFPNQQKLILGSLHWETGLVAAREINLTDGYHLGSAGGMQFHPTKGTEYVVAVTAVNGQVSRSLVLGCDYSFTPIHSFWTPASQRVESYAVSEISDSDKFGIIGVQDVNPGTNNYRAYLATLIWNEELACGSPAEFSSDTLTLPSTSATISETISTFPLTSIQDPTFTTYTDWQNTCLPTAIQSKAAISQIHLIPNPATDAFEVQNCPANSRFTLLDAMGRPAPIHHQNHKISIHHLPAGVYTLFIHASAGSQILKLVKGT